MVVRFPIDTPAIAWFAPIDGDHHDVGKIAEGALAEVLGAALNFWLPDRQHVFIEIDGTTYPVTEVKLGHGPVDGWTPQKDLGP